MSERVARSRDAWRLAILDYEQLFQALRFNRVQGLAPGFGTVLNTGVPFTTLHGGVRYGFGDQRVTGFVGLRRDAPTSRLEISAFRDMDDVEPWMDGTTLGNSLKALFAGHDDADYYFRQGGEVVFEGRLGEFRDVRGRIAVER